MSAEYIANSITTFFHSLAETNGFVVRYDNDPRDTPTDNYWMNISVDLGESSQVAVGADQFRTPGVFSIQIKGTTECGVAKILEIADIILDGFLSVTVNRLVCFQAPRVENVGRVGDNYQNNEICPFFVDDY